MAPSRPNPFRYTEEANRPNAKLSPNWISDPIENDDEIRWAKANAKELIRIFSQSALPSSESSSTPRNMVSSAMAADSDKKLDKVCQGGQWQYSRQSENLRPLDFVFRIA